MEGLECRQGDCGLGFQPGGRPKPVLEELDCFRRARVSALAEEHRHLGLAVFVHDDHIPRSIIDVQRAIELLGRHGARIAVMSQVKNEPKVCDAHFIPQAAIDAPFPDAIEGSSLVTVEDAPGTLRTGQGTVQTPKERAV